MRTRLTRVWRALGWPVRMAGRVVLAAAAQFDRSDLVLLAGLMLVTYGLAQWSRPVACLVLGALLVRLAWPPAAPPARRSTGEVD